MAQMKIVFGALMIIMILLQLMVKVDANDFNWFIQNKFLLIFCVRFFINMALLVLVCAIVFPKSKSKELLIPFYLFNMVVFLVSYFFNYFDFAISFAYGLFLVYSVWRYNYRSCTLKYLIVLSITIAIGLVTAFSKVEYLETTLLFTMIMVIVLLFNKRFNNLMVTSLRSESIEMIKPENYYSLKEDLQLKTKLNIDKIMIEEVDFIKNSAVIKVYYL